MVAAGDRAGGRARRLRDGQVLRRDLPRPAARGRSSPQAHDAGALGARRAWSGWRPAAWLLGLLPVQVIALIDPVTQRAGRRRPRRAAWRASGWLSWRPSAPERASYSPLLFLLGIVAASFALAFVLVRRLYHGAHAARRALGLRLPAAATARMQDTAEGFGQPIRQIFEPFFRMRPRTCPRPFDRRAALPRGRSTTTSGAGCTCRSRDAGRSRLARLVGLLQQGRISIYLMYSFVTLL
ncbi:MAG: hypothetical protein MZW92_34700, partial [Comamonadaceae bacterium]|nr:hypothetical protein [Comamonadaceae bacterium]